MPTLVIEAREGFRDRRVWRDGMERNQGRFIEIPGATMTCGRNEIAKFFGHFIAEAQKPVLEVSRSPV